MKSIKSYRIGSWVLMCYLIVEKTDATQTYTIGAMLSSPHLQESFSRALAEVNADPVKYEMGTAQVNGTSAILNQDPVQATMDICNKLIPNDIYAIITTHAVNSTYPPFIVSYSAAFYNIPVIGITARETEFSDKVGKIP